MILEFEQVGAKLDEMAEKLPSEIFNGLNGGVLLLPDLVKDPDFEDEVYILGEFCDDQMGRYINIYYGSLAALAEAEEWTREQWEQELRETLAHELTHHIESLAGDNSLDKKDDEQKKRWRKK